MKVIFNADDFGYSKAVNYGIIETVKNGVVRSTSIMSTMSGFEHAVEMYRECKELRLGVGVHLNIMTGKPLTKGLETLVDANGNFYKPALFESNKFYFDEDELMTELCAQVDKVIEIGIEPTHIDSHYGMHMQEPLFPLVCEIAKKYSLPLRMLDVNRMAPEARGIKTTDKFTSGFFAQNATFDFLATYLTRIQADTVEVLCRPAYVDLTLYNGSRYSVNRINEVEVLCNASLSKFLEAQGIESINYGDI